MNHNHTFRGTLGVRAHLLLTASALVVGLAGNVGRLEAQSIVQVPFSSTAAGIPGVASAATCTSINSIGDGCPPTQAAMTPYSTTVDAMGNIYIADYGNLTIRVVYEGGSALAAAIVAANPGVASLVPQAGYIYSLAGTPGLTKNPSAGGHCSGSAGPTAINALGDGCPGTESYVKSRGIAVDAQGNVFFGNIGIDQSVRVVYVGGTAAASLITAADPAATSPQPGYIYSIAASTAVSPMTAVSLTQVRDVAVDSNENVYFTDNSLMEVLKTSGTAGTTTIIAGTGATGYGGEGVPAASAEIDSPDAVFLDANNNLYFSEAGGAANSSSAPTCPCVGRLRVIYTAGNVPGLSNPKVGDIYTVAGGGTATASGSPANTLSLATSGVAGIDYSGNLYFTDSSHRIWQENASTGLAYTLTGVSYVSKPAAGASCSTAGTGPTMTDAIFDGCPGPNVNVDNPIAHISFDRFGNFYVADQGEDVIRKFSYNTQFPLTTTGNAASQPLAFIVVNAVTIATESFSLQSKSTAEFANGGSNTCALNSPLSIGSVCVFNVNFAPIATGNRLAYLTLQSSSARLAGSFIAGVGKAATLAIDPGTQTTIGSGLSPTGVGIDLSGDLYISDSNSNSLYRSVAGATPTVLSTGFNRPGQVTVDGKGDVYVADTGGNRIALASSTGGVATTYLSGFSGPQGVAADGYGNVYIADTGNNRIVEVPSGGGTLVLPVTGLSSPEGIAVDASNNLYIADTGNKRVVEFSIQGGQAVVNTGANAIVPVAVGVDPAGDIFVADSSNTEVIVVTQGGLSVNTLALGLQALAGLAIDSTGDVSIADSKTAGAVVVNRQTGNIVFPATNLGQYSTLSFLLNNTGNATLTATGSQLYTATGNTAVFSITPASASNACVVGAQIMSGTSCQLTATFSPTATTSYKETASFPDTAINDGSATAVLSGNGVQLLSTKTTINVTSPSGSPVYGQSVTLTATVAPTSGSGTPTGTVTFNVDGSAQKPLPIASATLTLTLAVGVHSITATYSGDTVYASSAGSTTVTVGKATPTIVFSVSQGVNGLTFSATVSSSVSTPTGTVTFSQGATTLDTASLTAGIASYTSTTLIYPSYVFTATYSGDSNFVSVTATSTNAGSFIAAQGVSTLTIPQGGVATDTLTMTSQFGFSGNLTFSCAGLPANTTCAFYPTPATLAAGSSVTTQMQLITNVPPANMAAIKENNLPSSAPLLALLTPIGVLVAFRKRKCRNAASAKAYWLLNFVCLLSFIPLFSIIGCGGGQTSSPTPVGTYSVRVTISGPNSTSYSLTYAFIVVAGSTTQRAS